MRIGTGRHHVTQIQAPAGETLLSMKGCLPKVGRMLQDSGMTLKTGTIVDATIIATPSSTKNADKKRDPEMRQTHIYRARPGEYLLVSKSVDGAGPPVVGKGRAKNPKRSPKRQNKMNTSVLKLNHADIAAGFKKTAECSAMP